MISYLKFLLIIIVLSIHLLNAQPSEEAEKDGNSTDGEDEGEADSVLQSEEDKGEEEEGPSPRAKGSKKRRSKSKKTSTKSSTKTTTKKKTTKHKKPVIKKPKAHPKVKTTTTTPEPTTTPESTTPEEEAETTETHNEETEKETTQLPETMNDINEKVGLRAADLKFLEGIYNGKNKKSYKEMSDKIYKALKEKYNQVNEELKNNQLFKAYVKNAHNVSEGVANAYNALEHKDLGTFLRDWYKMEYKPKKGEIEEVEKADEEQVTASPTKRATTKAPKKKTTKKATKKKKGKKKGIKSYSSAEEDHDDDNDEEGAEKVHMATKKVGIENYSREQLFKDLIEEHKRGKHKDVKSGIAESDQDKD